MNSSRFLANKIKNSKNQSFSSVIIKVGTLSIAIAVSVLIVSFFVLFGFKNTIKNKLFSLSSHIQVSKITLNRSFEEASMGNNLEFIKEISKNAKVKSVNKVALKSVILKSQKEIGGVVLKGIDGQYDCNEFSSNIIAGRNLTFEKDIPSNEIIISSKIADDLDLKLNENLLIYFIQNPPRARKLKIVGIYNSNVEELDQVYVIGDIRIIQKVNAWNNGEFGHLEIFLKNINDLDEMKKYFLDVIPVEYQVMKVTEILPQFFDWFNLLDRNIILVITLIIIVAAFNMISVLLIMIMERTPMIGLLKSIGTVNAKIRSIFIINGSKIIIKGIFFGNLVGLGICFLQYKYKFVKLDPVNYYMDFVPIEWSWSILLLINVGVFILVNLALLIPTFIIRNISPFESLKYKD